MLIGKEVLIDFDSKLNYDADLILLDGMPFPKDQLDELRIKSSDIKLIDYIHHQKMSVLSENQFEQAIIVIRTKK